MERKAAQGIDGPTGTTTTGEFDISALDPDMVAPFVVWLAGDGSANVNGYDFGVAAGDIQLYSQPQIIKTIYKKGRWTVDELVEVFPKTLGANLVNPSPAATPK
jgi:hypothetical protein